MKWRVLAITLVILLIGAGVGAALVYHIEDAAAALKETYKQDIEVYQSEKDMKIKNDVSSITQEEIERMEKETREYLQERIGSDYQNALNEKTEEIKKTTDQKIEEIKKYIDELLSAE